MTPGKSYTGKTLFWTILIAWGTEENVEFFFSRLSLGPGATGGRAPGSDLLSLPPQPSKSWMFGSPGNEWKRHRWALPRLGCQGTKAGLWAALCWGSSRSAGNFYHADFPSTWGFPAGCGWGVRLILQIPPTRQAATRGNAQWMGQQPDLGEVSLPGVSTYLLSLLFPNQAGIWLFHSSQLVGRANTQRACFS